jgi:hypothetical protein
MRRACFSKLMAMTTRQSVSPVRVFSALALAAGTALAALPASAEGIYLCVDAAGRRELTDTNKAGCRAINVPGAIAAPPARRAPAAPRVAGTPAPAETPANFPRVDTSAQKARDNDRREILNEELRAEQNKLAELRREFKNGEPDRLGNERNYAKYQERVVHLRDNIGRSEKNIEALRREIGNIK